MKHWCTRYKSGVVGQLFKCNTKNLCNHIIVCCSEAASCCKIISRFSVVILLFLLLHFNLAALTQESYDFFIALSSPNYNHVFVESLLKVVVDFVQLQPWQSSHSFYSSDKDSSKWLHTFANTFDRWYANLSPKVQVEYAVILQWFKMLLSCDYGGNSTCLFVYESLSLSLCMCVNTCVREEKWGRAS